MPVNGCWLRHIDAFPREVTRAAEQLAPNSLADYVF